MATYDEAVKAAFEQAGALIAVFEGDDLVFRAANPVGLAALGGPDVIGHSARQVFGEWGPRHLLDVLDDVLGSGRPRLVSEWSVPVEGADGRQTEHVFDLSVDPWRDDSGAVTGVIARGRDVSSAARAHQRAARRAESALAVVRTLQDVLLPEDLPVLPGLDIESSYLLAGEHAAAGGDWYDVLVRPSGRVVLAAGDVVGHGAAASAVMGQLRAVLHDRLMDDTPLIDAVRAIDRHCQNFDGLRSATVVLVEVALDSGELTYVTAGHPRPLVVGVTGASGYLPASVGGPLGTRSDYRAAAAKLREGEMLVLYTDGAVERPERTPRQGATELSAIVSEAFLNRTPVPGNTGRASERVCAAGLEQLAQRTGHRDDITLLAAQRVAPLGPLSLRMPAEAASVSRCRLELAAWLEGAGARSLDAIALQHSVGELVDNVIRHAYVDAPAARLGHDAVAVDVQLLRTGEVEVVVSDRGGWRAPAGGDGGRGLAMARGFMDQMSLERSDRGTTARLRHRLTRPARLNASRAVLPSASTGFGIEITRDQVAVRGDVDARSVDELRVTLDRATYGRTSAVTVDLTDVTHLGSTAVQLLFELLREAPETGLVARAGCVADQVLDVVQLGHAT